MSIISMNAFAITTYTNSAGTPRTRIVYLRPAESYTDVKPLTSNVPAPKFGSTALQPILEVQEADNRSIDEGSDDSDSASSTGSSSSASSASTTITIPTSTNHLEENVRTRKDDDHTLPTFDTVIFPTPTHMPPMLLSPELTASFESLACDKTRAPAFAVINPDGEMIDLYIPTAHLQRDFIGRPPRGARRSHRPRCPLGRFPLTRKEKKKWRCTISVRCYTKTGYYWGKNGAEKYKEYKREKKIREWREGVAEAEREEEEVMRELFPDEYEKEGSRKISSQWSRMKNCFRL